MTCPLNEEQIQAWLDGAPEHAHHALECAECQSRSVVLQKLRSRLAPPASPLGKDFARATAARVLEQAGQQRPRSKSEANPLHLIVRRERNRRFFRLPSLAAVLLLFSVPGYLFSFGEVERQVAYFGTVQFGLTVILPLALLALEWSTLAGLVRGRCLEEILSTGLAPRTVTDTLASNGMRSLAPLLLLTSLSLLPFAGQSALLWLPVAAVTFVGCNYAMQAQMLVANRSPLMGLMALGACLAGLVAPAPWSILALCLLIAVSIVGRSRVILALSEMQQGKSPARSKRPGRRVEMWLSRRLPDMALLQRELRRGGMFSPGWMAGSLYGCALMWYFSLDLSGTIPVIKSIAQPTSDLIAPTIFGAALAISASLLQRERASGTHEVLLHSGITREDWWRNCSWISGLKLAPAILCASLLWGLSGPSEELLTAPVRVLGFLCLLLVCNWSGAVIGVASAWEGSLREASGRAVSHCLMAASYYLAGLLLLMAPLGDQSSLARLLGERELLGMIFNDFSAHLLLLLTMLALWLRARQASVPRWTEQPVLPVLGLVPAVPIAVFSQLAMAGKLQAAFWWAGLSLGVGLLWSWWAIPLLRHPRKHPLRWALLTTSYLTTVVTGCYCLAWLLVFHWNDQLLQMVDSRIHLNFAALSLTVYLWGLSIALLGMRQNWKSATHANKGWAWLPLGLTTLAALLGISWSNYLNRSIANRAEVESFLQSAPPKVPKEGAYSHLPALEPWKAPSEEFRQDLLRLLQQKSPADTSLPRIYSDLTKSGDRLLETGQRDQAISNVELMVAMSPQLHQIPYTYWGVDSSRRLATCLLQSGHLSWRQVNRLEKAMQSLDGLSKRVLYNNIAYARYLDIRQKQGKDRSVEGQLYLNQQSLLYLSCYLSGTPTTSPELHHINVFPGSGYWSVIFGPVLALEKIRLAKGAYPEKFQYKGLKSYREEAGQSYRLTLLYQGRLLRLQGGPGSRHLGPHKAD